MEFKPLKKILKSISDHRPLPFIQRVQAIWHVALGVSIFGMIGMAVFSWFLFTKIQNDTLFQSQTDVDAAKSLIKETRLESVLQKFGAKAENFANINLAKPKINDPSL